MSICLSVHMEQLGSHWTDFHKIFYSSIFRKIVLKIQLSFKSDKNYGYLTCLLLHVCDSSSLNSTENDKCFGQICRVVLSCQIALQENALNFKQYMIMQ
jgi:hypothetical protein